MFMNPPDYDEYLRARYYVGTHDTAAVKWVATELIFPAHREDQVRLVQSFRDSYTDKAIAIALSAFLRARFAAGAEVPEDETDLPENLAPVAGYFSRRFARESLVPGERVLRTELWLARAPNPAPGVGPDFEKVEERRAILQQLLRRTGGRPAVPR